MSLTGKDVKTGFWHLVQDDFVGIARDDRGSVFAVVNPVEYTELYETAGGLIEASRYDDTLPDELGRYSGTRFLLENPDRATGVDPRPVKVVNGIRYLAAAKESIPA